MPPPAATPPARPPKPSATVSDPYTLLNTYSIMYPDKVKPHFIDNETLDNKGLHPKRSEGTTEGHRES